jgi:hypothetical protein
METAINTVTVITPITDARQQKGEIFGHFRSDCHMIWQNTKLATSEIGMNRIRMKDLKLPCGNE